LQWDEARRKIVARLDGAATDFEVRPRKALRAMMGDEEFIFVEAYRLRDGGWLIARRLPKP
jgi:hypothetical protein